MRILVTGGAGFIGSNLVDALIKEGDEVLVVDNLSCGKKEYVNEQAELIKLDILDKKFDIKFKEFNPEIVYHLAAQKDVRVSLKDPAFDAKVNIVGSLGLFSLCTEQNVKKLIFASTGGALYDETDRQPLTEKSRIRPLSPYGIAKYASDLYLDFFKSKYNLPFVSLRMANVYGPRQDPLGEAGVVAIFFDKFINNEIPHINGTGRQSRDFVYVGDVVKAFGKAKEEKVQGFYNIGTGKETAISDLYNIQADICSVTDKPEYKEAVAGEVMRNALDFTKASKELDWQPVVDINEGLLKTYEWFKSKI